MSRKINLEKYIESGKQHCIDQHHPSIEEFESIRKSSNDAYEIMLFAYFYGYERAYRSSVRGTQRGGDSCE